MGVVYCRAEHEFPDELVAGPMQYLDEYDYGHEFRRCFFNPRVGGSFPMPDRDPEDYFIRPLVAYWQMDGSVGSGPANSVEYAIAPALAAGSTLATTLTWNRHVGRTDNGNRREPGASAVRSARSRSAAGRGRAR